MYDIFLSYRRDSGSAYASFLNEALKRLGYKVFFDYEALRSGDFKMHIDQAIDECTFFLLLLAPHIFDHSLTDPENDWILYESQRAIRNGKIIVPVCIQKGFEFPQPCENETIDALSRLNICDLSGTDAAKLVDTLLIEFLDDHPAKALAEAYNKGITEPAYIEWELQTLKGIYHDIPLVHAFGKEYPAYVVPGAKEVVYPFDSLTRNGTLLPITEPLPFDQTPWYPTFRRIVGPNIHFPKLYGYTSNGFNLNAQGEIQSIICTPRTYEESVYTCHILQYELWSVYQEIGSLRPATLEDLPMRKAIHDGRSNIDVILSGCNRSSLNDVTIAVMDYNERTEEYGIASAVRTEKVATYPNYFGFIPSGGFELYELEENQSASVIRENFSVVGALFREYIEELFGDCGFGMATGDDDLNRLFRNEKVKILRDGVRNGTYKFEFLGVDFDLITLRQTLAFVLRIDDPNFFYDNDIRKNDENAFVKFEPLRTLETHIAQENLPVMVETAATYTLLINHRLFQEVVENDYRLV